MPKNKKAKYKEEVRKSNIPAVILVIFFLLLILSTFSIVFSYNNRLAERNSADINALKFVSLSNATLVAMNLPAVDDKGNGIITLLVVEAMPGTGRTLVDIDNLLFWADTQQSIRLSRLVAANIASFDINNYDLIYSIHANASVIGGESAGAALTIATIAAIQNKTIKKDVMITGTINHDGSIGPVSEIFAKATAAKKVGATLFLVPLLQNRDVIYETKEHCENFGPTKICSIEQLPKRIDVSNQTGIEIKEVSSIREALNYILSEKS